MKYVFALLAAVMMCAADPAAPQPFTIELPPGWQMVDGNSIEDGTEMLFMPKDGNPGTADAISIAVHAPRGRTLQQFAAALLAEKDAPKHATSGAYSICHGTQQGWQLSADAQDGHGGLRMLLGASPSAIVAVSYVQNPGAPTNAAVLKTLETFCMK